MGENIKIDKILNFIEDGKKANQIIDYTEIGLLLLSLICILTLDPKLNNVGKIFLANFSFVYFCRKNTFGNYYYIYILLMLAYLYNYLPIK